MHHHFSLLLFVWLVLIGSGCVTAGNDVLRNETKSSVSQKIVPGETTQEEIRGVFGAPSGTSFTDSGRVIWRYEGQREGRCDKPQ